MQYFTLSIILSSFYDVALCSAILPLIVFIVMVVGKIRHNLGLIIWNVLVRVVAGWGLIVFFYYLLGVLQAHAFQDLGAFIDAPTKGNTFVRYYPVGVFIIGMSGLYYPWAKVFNDNRTKAKRITLCIICFMPLYLMLAYMFFVDYELWGLCAKFGMRSSMLAFIISLPIIFFNLPNSLLLALRWILLFLFHVNKPTVNTMLS